MKSKTGSGFGDPLEMVGAEKQRRVRRAAEAWLAWHGPADAVVRFDVIVVRGRRLEAIRQAF